ncbi:hypothetical protein M0R45_030301 [Rubus argutus]|uniref:Uncharacterized protein n=1 Tax=Rubus argutus TaxID=59490 RepID=A0AAW1WCR6_RUBAR
MALSYGLSLNVFLVSSVQLQCMIENSIIFVDRVEQYMHITSEATQVIENNQPPSIWHVLGKVEILNLKARYKPNSLLVLRGINCIIKGGYKARIVGRTGSGKTNSYQRFVSAGRAYRGKMEDALQLGDQIVKFGNVEIGDNLLQQRAYQGCAVLVMVLR